ncbi:hypothetical protein MMC20_008098 [Loxospora ochrophaea]|nr:hypothetical protein [Loxospora ochrophaea]
MSSSQVLATSNDRGPVINLANWIMVVVMVLSTFTKLATKYGRIHTIVTDDYLMLAAMVVLSPLMSVGHSVAISEQVSGGLGKHQYSLSPSQVDKYQQVCSAPQTGKTSGYTSQIFYVLAICFSQLAVLQIFTTFARNEFRVKIIRGVMIFAVVWAVTAIFAIAFQCHVPNPWTIIVSDRCFNQPAFWDVIEVFDMLVDLVVTILPIYLLSDVKLPWSKKLFIMSAFAGRALMLPVTILRLVYISSAYHSLDRTYADFNTVITTVVDVNISIILACIPFLKPFVDSLQIGLFNSDPRILVPIKARDERTGYDLSWLSKSGQTGQKETVPTSGRFHLGSPEWTKIQNTNNDTNNTHTGVTSGGSRNPEDSQRATQTV